MLVSAVAPAVLLSIRRVRTSIPGLAVCASATVVGMVWNRLNVAIVAISRPEGMAYFPSWIEVTVTLGVTAAAVLAFLFLVEHLRVYEERARVAAKTPSYDPASMHMLTPSAMAAPRRYSLAFVVAAAVVALLLPREAVVGVRPALTPIAEVRAVDGVVIERGDAEVSRLDVVVPAGVVPNGARARRLLMVNGNRNDELVLFDHEAHMTRVAGGDSCATCHHINMPLDRASACSDCHRDMYEPTDVFNHVYHVNKLDGNDGCVKCHTDSSAVKTRETATACSHCHEEQTAKSDIIEAPEPRWRSAVGYMDAMHGLCITCHERAEKETPGDVAEHLHRCDACHDVDYAKRVAQLMPTGEEER
jgi:hypothetical protein